MDLLPVMQSRNNDVGKIGEVKFAVSVKVGAVAAILAVTAIGLYALQTVDRDIIRFAVSAVVAAAGITSAFYVGEGIRRNLDARADDFNAKKAERAMAYISAWTNPSFALVRKSARKVRDQLAEAKNQHPNKEESQIIQEFLRQQSDLAEDIVTILNFLEEIALAVEFQLVDDQIIRNYFGFIIERFCHVFEVWITEERRKRGNDLYSNLSRLHTKWRSGNNH